MEKINEDDLKNDRLIADELEALRWHIVQNIPNCYASSGEEEEGWDVIIKKPAGIEVARGAFVRKVYVRLQKNHPSMNSLAGLEMYVQMQNRLLAETDCSCLLVETMAKPFTNIRWVVSVDGQRIGHKLIRRASLDRFYDLVTE